MLVLTVNRVVDNSKMFVEKIFVNHYLSAKFANTFSHENFPFNGMLSDSVVFIACLLPQGAHDHN